MLPSRRVGQCFQPDAWVSASSLTWVSASSLTWVSASSLTWVSASSLTWCPATPPDSAGRRQIPPTCVVDVLRTSTRRAEQYVAVVEPGQDVRGTSLRKLPARAAD